MAEQSEKKRFVFMIQLDWFPGCGWLQSPHPCATFEEAWKEGETYVQLAWQYRGNSASLRVKELKG